MKIRGRYWKRLEANSFIKYRAIWGRKTKVTIYKERRAKGRLFFRDFTWEVVKLRSNFKARIGEFNEF